ncbi:MAG: ORC1-type DNA replication protein [Candidatus Nanoarchaeia archaeon]|nr:ORC1-type DNA replication protein [Candidatus Nanoarchaeia archaeon]
MVSKKLNGFFEKFLQTDSLFANKKVLQSVYVPNEMEHRDEQINQIANILAPALKVDKPSNLFIYGKTGTGKTASVRYTTEQIHKVAKENNIPVNVIYINCKLKKIADTEYRLIAEIARALGKEIPPTGLPTDEVYNIFFKALDFKEQILILILDEIDQLIKRTGDEVIYNLTRINSELKNSQISIIGISNDLMFSNYIDPRVKSSLSEEEIIFPPYNALQIQDILRKRASLAFKKDAVDEGVIPKCAAFAAREHGDARRALELLRVAGELAERSESKIVQIKHIDEAEEKIEKDRIIDVVHTQPKQFQLVLYSIFLIRNDEQNKKKQIFTGDLYDIYKDLCPKAGLRPITQRRLSDIVAELDMLGLITAKVISKGRFGRTREINLGIPSHLLNKVETLLAKELEFNDKKN